MPNDRINWTRTDWDDFLDGWSFARLGYPRLTTQNVTRFHDGKDSADTDEKERAAKRAAAASSPS